jgi:probable selenium-dependent hydroxylase accessory protein YqeC
MNECGMQKMRLLTKEFTTFRDAFQLNTAEVISLVGGGGKTTLMFALAAELVSNGKSVVTTTTTKILEPDKAQSPMLLLDTDEVELMRAFTSNIGKLKHVTLGSDKLATGRLKGISPQMVEKLARSKKVDSIIIEADGAAGKPLKAPNATEPVIPANTTLVIPVVGADAIGGRLSPENVFRPEIVSQLLNIPAEEIVSAKFIAALLTHPEGIIKGTPKEARVVLFINKTDLDGGAEKANGLAEEILKARHPQIKRVVMGQANKPGAVLTVMARN